MGEAAVIFEQGLSFAEDALQDMAGAALAEASRQGASAAMVAMGESLESDIGVRDGKTESIVAGQDLSAMVTVFIGQRTGSASSNSFAETDITTTVARAIAIAKQMNEDECHGLPERDWLASGEAPDFDQYHPWRPSIDEMLELAHRMEEASCAVDPRISRAKSEGAAVGIVESRGVIANSLGFSSCRTGTRAVLSCSALAEVEEGMETESWHDSKRAHADLEDPETIGRIAGERAVARCKPRPIKSAKVPVVFESGCAHRLIGALTGGLGAGSVYRKLTYLAGKQDEKIAADHLSVSEDPFLVRGMESSHHDAEGVATKAKDIVSGGRLATYLAGSYYARKLGMKSTGNAGGTRNLRASYRELPRSELLKEMDCGLLVTSTMGRGANFVTGAYSAGASGFWVEGGEIAYPVKDATIAGELPAMYCGIVAGGDDRRLLGGIDCGSLLLNELVVGGSA